MPRKGRVKELGQLHCFVGRRTVAQHLFSMTTILRCFLADDSTRASTATSMSALCLAPCRLPRGLLCASGAPPNTRHANAHWAQRRTRSAGPRRTQSSGASSPHSGASDPPMMPSPPAPDSLERSPLSKTPLAYDAGLPEGSETTHTVRGKVPRASWRRNLSFRPGGDRSAVGLRPPIHPTFLLPPAPRPGTPNASHLLAPRARSPRTHHLGRAHEISLCPSGAARYPTRKRPLGYSGGPGAMAQTFVVFRRLFSALRGPCPTDGAFAPGASQAPTPTRFGDPIE